MKLRVADIKSSIGKVLNLNADDPRVISYINRACERLLYDAGKSVDTIVRYVVCLNSGCITWPREIETIEAWEQCGAGTVRNQWYEFLGYGPGGMSSGGGSSDQLVDRGNAVAFDDVVGTGKKLAVWADSVEDAGLQLLVRYYDGNANKVYTNMSDAAIALNIPSDGSVAAAILAAQQIYIDRRPAPPNNSALTAINWDSASGTMQVWNTASQSWV